MSQFVHLHLHTQYSLLDGVNKLPNIVEKAAKLGQPAIAITDHGNMHGALEFYSACKDHKIKPIIGCEFYITAGSRHERVSKAQGGEAINHLTVVAKNNQGYTNLCKLISLAYKEGFYFKPRIDHEILARYSEGLIVLSGCLNSELGNLITLEQDRELKQRIQFYSSIFKEDYFLEVQPHQIALQQNMNKVLADYAKEVGIAMVATTDCHYPEATDHYAQEVLMCVSTGRQITDPDRIRHEGVHLHLKNYQEMKQEFGVNNRYAEEAIKNTVMIADRCDLKFDFNTYYMPRYELPPEKTLDQELENLSRDGLESRFQQIKDRGEWDANSEQEYRDRLELELQILIKMGFAGYFLVVADFINWAKEQDVPVGPGRGSAAGSLVAYALRITEVDPIIHKLLFERFLNPERISMPDIDVDFCITGRDRVIKYVVDKYGADKVAQIATFGTLKAKAAIKDVGRALGMSYAETDRIAQLVPAPRQGFDYPLSEAIKMEPRLAEYAKGQGKDLIELALKLEGLNRHTSTHAAGVVIGDRPLDEMLPMMVDKDGKDVTQYSMKYVEKIGLVKFDFLGLKTLTVINTAVKLIKASQGLLLDPNNLRLDDSKTYSMLCAGNTTGVFQLESSGITDMTMRLKPSCFNDLVAILALYRPGPLDAGMVDHYINRKHGRAQVEYLHPDMKLTLSDTYGIIVYQEQIMQLAQVLSGYSLGEADLLRRAMGKKDPAEMAKQRNRFLEGAKKNTINDRLAAEIFDQMETFARYGFNRSHSAAYAMISYQTAYLRAHYPVEFMAALMSHEMDDSDKVLKNMNECRRHQIKVLPPDVNKSFADFSVEERVIRFGMSAVKGVGDKAVDAIVKARVEGGPFEGLEDLVSRVEIQALNKRVMENLIRSGAFDFSGLSRNELMERLEPVMKAAQNLQKEQDTNQISLFSAEVMSRTVPVRNTNRPEWPINQKLSNERDALGFYLSGHPIEKFYNYLKALGTKSISEVKDNNASAKVRIGGVVTALKLKNTKKGTRYASLVFEDMSGTIESLVWPDTYLKVGELLEGSAPVIATGRIDVGDERSTFVIENLESLIELRDRRATQGVLVFRQADQLTERKEELLSIINKYRGEVPLKVKFDFQDEQIQFILKDGRNVPISVRPSEELCEQIEQLFGRPVLNFL